MFSILNIYKYFEKYAPLLSLLLSNTRKMRIRDPKVYDKNKKFLPTSISLTFFFRLWSFFGQFNWAQIVTPR